MVLKKVALIPARSGSKRIANKNIRNLNGHPLIAYSIQSAIDCKLFDSIICATDSVEYAEIATYYGAEVPILRDPNISGDKSSDIEWVTWLIHYLENNNRNYNIFSILRPTSPFRSAETIKRAWNQFISAKGVDSLRAVELCKQHPGKMWIVTGDVMCPLLPISTLDQPMHSTQYAALPKIFVQNASLEIAYTKVIKLYQNISGYTVTPFFTTEYEGLDLNDDFDWWNIQRQLELGTIKLPLISKKSWFLK